MKTKLFRTKSIIALALALFMVMPMLFAAVPYAKAAPGTTPVLSVVPTGAAAPSSTTMIAGAAVGSTFTVDIRIDNIGSVSPGINGLSYTLTYDPIVLQLVANHPKNVSFWGTTAAGDLSAIVTQSSGAFTESSIIFPSGANDESTNTPGVATQITFKVLTTGTCNLNLQASDTGIAYMTYPDPTGTSHDVTATTENAIYNPNTSIGMYQFGQSNSVITFAPGTDPIGSTFTVAVNITNAKVEPIWGWNIGVSWNPAVLQLESITEGTYLSTNTGLIDGADTLFVKGQIDNTIGTVKQGISDVYLSNTTTTALSGTLCNLTFNVINWASSPITLSAGIPTLIDNLGNSQSCTLNSASYVTPQPPAPTSPTAIITPPTSTLYLAGAQITLNSASLGGIDVVPNASSPNFPITSYTWTVVSGGFTITNTNTDTITFTAPTPAVPFTIGLTVSTATNPDDAAYHNVSNQATISFSPAFTQPTTAGAQIDVYIVNPAPYTTTYMQKDVRFTSQGIYNNTDPVKSYVDTFAPQELMNLTAFVTYNGASVSNKIVAFSVQKQ